MKKEIISSLLISIGLSFIFSVAAHGPIGILVGVCFFLVSIYVIKKKQR